MGPGLIMLFCVFPGLASNLFPVSPVNSSDFLFSLANNVLVSG